MVRRYRGAYSTALKKESSLPRSRHPLRDETLYPACTYLLNNGTVLAGAPQLRLSLALVCPGYAGQARLGIWFLFRCDLHTGGTLS